MWPDLIKNDFAGWAGGGMRRWPCEMVAMWNSGHVRWWGYYEMVRLWDVGHVRWWSYEMVAMWDGGGIMRWWDYDDEVSGSLPPLCTMCSVYLPNIKHKWIWGMRWYGHVRWWWHYDSYYEMVRLWWWDVRTNTTTTAKHHSVCSHNIEHI